MEILKNRETEKTTSDLAAETILEKIGKQEGKKKTHVENLEEDQETLSLLREDESQNGEVFDILNNLRDELIEFEKIKKGISAKIETTSALIPQISERRELLAKEINEKEKQITEIEELIPQLIEKKQNLESNIIHGKEEIELLEKEIKEKQAKNEEISQLIPKLERNRKKMLDVVNAKHNEISKIDEQVNQIRDIQKYGVDLLSTLIYATKRNKT